MLTNWLILDVASAPLPNAEDYLEGTVRAPSNYKDQAKIDEYIREKQAERVAMAATDVDLAQIIGMSWRGGGIVKDYHGIATDCDQWEIGALDWLADVCEEQSPAIITFGGFNFDLPMVARRARYVGLMFPEINLDRYRSKHFDLCELLSDRNPQRRKSLDFYVKRLGWDDLMPKPLTGAEESQVPVSGRWDELAASLKRDVEATYRLAVWAGVIEPVKTMSPEQSEVGF